MKMLCSSSEAVLRPGILFEVIVHHLLHCLHIINVRHSTTVVYVFCISVHYSYRYTVLVYIQYMYSYSKYCTVQYSTHTVENVCKASERTNVMNRRTQRTRFGMSWAEVSGCRVIGSKWPTRYTVLYAL